MNDVTAIDIADIRDDIDELSAFGHRVLPATFQFVTVTIWGSQYRGPQAGVEVRLHIKWDSKAFSAAAPLEAIRDAGRWLLEHDPARIEAEGWATLGATVAS
jgi:hypothetical protein